MSDALQQVPGEANLTVLSAGPPPPNPSELLSSVRTREVFAATVATADLVIVDSPPVLPVSDALIVSGMVDATLLVASANSSSRRALHRSVEVLRQVAAPLIGTVLNNAESLESYGGYGYEYTAVVGNGAKGDRGSRRERRKANHAKRSSARQRRSQRGPLLEPGGPARWSSSSRRVATSDRVTSRRPPRPRTST